MPMICYQEKDFRGERLELINKINEVIRTYRAQGYQLTLRQVYYQMVARAIIPNNEKSYKNLGNLISDARLAGLIDWESIEDRTRNLKSRSKWTTPGHIIESAAWSYHIDWWKGQEYYVEVWVEKDALVGIVGQICGELDISYFSCRGYVSQSEMWGASQRLIRRQNNGQEVVILHLGDHDPSGKDMSRDIQERLTDTFEVAHSSFHFKRLALNHDQIQKYNPPPNPTKLTDSRADGYIAEFGYECWELDALEPSVIKDLISINVAKYRDEEKYLARKRQEDAEKHQLQDISSNWGKVISMWEKHRDDEDEADGIDYDGADYLGDEGAPGDEDE